jgi:hypothetical protein
MAVVVIVVAAALMVRKSRPFLCATSTLFIVPIVLMVSFLIVFIVFLVTSVLLYRLRKV